MDFRKVIYENIKKNIYSLHNKHIYIYWLQPFWNFMKFYFVHIAKACFVFKKQSSSLYSSVYA